MNLKLKTLVAAMAMVVGGTFAGGAQAAVVSSDNALGIPGSGTGSGNLFLSVIDTVNKRSFLLNTNTTANQFRANPNAPQLFSNAALNQFLTDAGTNVNAVRWNIGAISNSRPGGDNDVANYGILTTSTPGQVLDPLSNIPPGNTGLEGTIGNAGQYLSSVNTWDGNGDLVFDITTQDYVIVPFGNTAYHNGGFWGNQWGGGTGFTTDGAIGESLNFWYIHSDPAESTFTSLLDQTAGNWKLDFAAGNAALSYTVIPVPAAVWLLGSGLLGLIGVARRRV